MQAVGWEMMVGGTSGPWPPTLRAWSHTIQPDWRGLPVRQDGSAILIRTEGENANSHATAHGIKIHLSKNLSVTLHPHGRDARLYIHNVKCFSSAPLSLHLITRQLWQQLCITHRGHWWCRYRSEPAAGWWAALDDPPHGNIADNPGQPQILGRSASVPQWRCS